MPLYQGYTTNARQRFETHFKHAAWASWVEDVRYRKCSSPQSARKLESRLKKKIPPVFIFAHHDDFRPVWQEIAEKFKADYVKGTCKLPDSLCDPDYWVNKLGAIDE